MLVTQAPGERRRVDEAVLGRVAGGHGRRQHVPPSERVHRQARGQRRVDAAGEAEDGVGEPALARVVAQAEHERAVRRLLVGPARVAQDRRSLRPGRVAGQRHVVEEEVLVEVASAQDLLAVRRDADRVAVEDQFVVAPHLIEIEEVAAVLDGFLPDQVPPHGRLLQRERTGRHVDEEVRVLVRELAHRIPVIQAPRPERLVVPDVLADRDAQAHALELERRHGAGRLEVAVLVEDVVGGQQRLLPAPRHAPLAAERDRVHQRLARGRGVPVDETDQDAERRGRERRHAIELLEVQVDEAVVIQQIARRIAGRRHLGEHDEVGAPGVGARDGRANGGEILIERSDGEIELGESQSHDRSATISLPAASPSGPVPGERGRRETGGSPRSRHAMSPGARVAGRSSARGGGVRLASFGDVDASERLSCAP